MPYLVTNLIVIRNKGGEREEEVGLVFITIHYVYILGLLSV